MLTSGIPNQSWLLLYHHYFHLFRSPRSDLSSRQSPTESFVRFTGKINLFSRTESVETTSAMCISSLKCCIHGSCQHLFGVVRGIQSTQNLLAVRQDCWGFFGGPPQRKDPLFLEIMEKLAAHTTSEDYSGTSSSPENRADPTIVCVCVEYDRYAEFSNCFHAPFLSS